MPVIYLKSRRRRPIWRGIRPGLQDLGGEIPLGWCEGCGLECYLHGQRFCLDCEGKEGRK